MRYGGKYSLTEQFYNNRELNLLTESTRGHVFEQTLVNYIAAKPNWAGTAIQSGVAYDMDLDKSGTGAKAEIKLDQKALLGDVSLSYLDEFSYDTSSKTFTLVTSAAGKAAFPGAPIVLQALNQSQDAKNNMDRILKYFGLSGQIFIRKGGKSQYSQFTSSGLSTAKGAVNAAGDALGEKQILTIPITGQMVFNYLKGKGIDYIFFGRNDENNAAACDVGVIGTDSLGLGIGGPCTLPDCQISMRLTSSKGGSQLGFRMNQSMAAGGSASGLKDITQCTW